MADRYRVKGTYGIWIDHGPAPCSCDGECRWFIKEGTQSPWRAFRLTDTTRIKEKK